MDFETQNNPQEGIPEAPVKQRISEKKNQQRAMAKNVLIYLHDLAYLLAVVMILFLLVFRVVVVSGPSMYSTLMDGDYLLLITGALYNDPQSGDVIVACKDSFEDGMPIVKRVIAVEGQEVDIDFQAGVVYVDGIALEEPYTNTPTNLMEGVKFPVTVPNGCVFVMGDNRNESRDSRYPGIGMIDEREILGKAIFLFLPGTHDGEMPRDFSRIGVVD